MTMKDFHSGDNHGLSKFNVCKYISLSECLYINISATDSFWNLLNVKVADLSMVLKVK